MCSITGDSSKTEDRTINLAMVGTGTGNGAEEAITSCDGIRQHVFGGGGGDTRRVAIFAHAGAGKTWMMAQLKRKCSKVRKGAAAEWVPVFVAVQAIANALHGSSAGWHQRTWQRRRQRR